MIQKHETRARIQEEVSGLLFDDRPSELQVNLSKMRFCLNAGSMMLQLY